MTRGASPVIGLMLLSATGASGQAGDAGRVFVNINAVHQCCVQDGSYSFWLSEPLRGKAIDAPAVREVRHRLAGAAARDISGGVRLWRNLAVGFGVSTFHTRSSAEVVRVDQTGSADSTASGASAGAVSGLDHHQAGYHFQAAWIARLTDRFEVTAFGGPSHFRVNYESVVDVAGNHAYPPIVTRRSSRRATGRNFGFDFTLLVTDRLGVGILVRIATATVEPLTRDGRGVIRLGGSHLGIGARIRL